jgi:hypothetical protein
MRRSVVAVLLFLPLAAQLHAITFVPLSFSDLVNASSAVVYARVADVKGQWTDDRRSIESVVTLTVIDAFKGAPGDRLTMVVPGGQAGRFINVIPGAPSFAEGDMVVAFVTARGARLPIATGLTQGIYRVTRDAATGSVVVVPPMIEAGGPAPFDSAQGRRIVRGDPQRRPLSLPAFEAAVRSVHEAAR